MSEALVPPGPGLVPSDRPRHQFYGRHGDIKPLNLLWFPNPRDPDDMGTIKICDFGEGEFSSTESSMRDSNSIAYTPSYRPPECDHGDPEINISATYDTWTLGCLFLEFVTWYIGGWELLDEFEQSRRSRNAYPAAPP